MKNNKKIILIDMDDTLCDFTLGFHKELKKENVPMRIKKIDPSDRSFYHLAQNYPDEYSDLIINILMKKGFIENLRPVKDSIKVINRLMEKYTVFFCSSPLKCSLSTSSEEKHKWIQKYFKTSENLILTNDKTLIKADYLIDDKFPITGIHEPIWNHIIYNRSHNSQKGNYEKIRVESWEDVLNYFI